MSDSDDGATRPATTAARVVVLDIANILGSVPDGWWRDRVTATQRLLSGLASLAGRTVAGPDGGLVRLARMVVVLEGQANRVTDPTAGPEPGLEIVRAPGSGDDAIADVVEGLVADGERVLVVTADRGLRARLPAVAATTGPSWLNELVGRRRQ